MLVPLALDALMRACAPSVAPRTLAAVVAFESGGRPEAIGDNSARRAYFPSGPEAAERLAGRLLSAGHDLDLGLMQLNARNLRPLGMSLRSAFDACSNLAGGARILGDDYARAARRYGPGQVALFHALSAYNSGNFRGGIGYARRVYGEAAQLRFETRR